MEKMVVLNHKSCLTYDEVKNYIKNIKDKIRTDLNVIMIPSMCYLPLFNGKYNFKLGSQNISFCNGTGEVKADQLKSLGVSYVLIGHSERRSIFGEDDSMINLKIKYSIENGITPIVCIGESFIDRERKKTQEVLLRQLKSALLDVDVDNDIVIAYEPVWAIGTDKIPTKDEISEVVSMIKNSILRKYNKDVKVLYGGNVNYENISMLLDIPLLDGFLIGRVGIDVDKITKLMNFI